MGVGRLFLLLFSVFQSGDIDLSVFAVVKKLYMYLCCECIYIMTYGNFSVNTKGVKSI